MSESLQPLAQEPLAPTTKETETFIIASPENNQDTTMNGNTINIVDIETKYDEDETTNTMKLNSTNVLTQRSHNIELIDNILSRLKIALTFLLHDKSPLHSNNTTTTLFHDRTMPYNGDANADFETYSTQTNYLYLVPHNSDNNVEQVGTMRYNSEAG
eukprot:224764_1